MKQTVRILFIFSLLHLMDSCIHAQSISGLNGLGAIPSAEMNVNGTILLGSSYFDHHNFEYGQYTYNGLAGYVSLTFLPFVEISFRYTSQLRTISRENDNFPDRMPSIRFRVLKETNLLPSIAIGVHDLSSVDGGGAKHFEASYLVLTKNVLANNLNLKINTGYGFGIFDASNHSVKGIFGGFALSSMMLPPLEAIVEYDSEDLNTGIKYTFWKRLQLMALARECKYLEGNITFRTIMK